jgi:hypothetical protein
LLINYSLFCLWSNLFWILKWDFVFIVFICWTVFFTIFRLATFTFLRTIFLRRYLCKISRKLLARKLFDMSSSHCSFKTFRYAINCANDWLFRWWSNLIFCSTILIRSLMRLIYFFKKSQNYFQKEIDFVVSSNRNRYFCQIQSNSETLLLNRNLTKLIRWKSFS